MRRSLAMLTLFMGGSGCRIEPPDPASEALAILNKRPAGFLDRMLSMEDLVTRHFPVSNRNRNIPDSLPHWRQSVISSGFDGLSDSGKAEVLVRFFFDSLKFGAVENGDSLSLSLPGWILSHRRGSCVGLSVLFLALAEALEIPARAVFLPGHLFIRIKSGPDSWRSVEMLRAGVARPDSFYRQTFRLAERPWYDLISRPPETALSALLFNLANFHKMAGRHDIAMAEFRVVSSKIPDFPDALGNEGALLLSQGNILSAREKLAKALAGDSLSQPAWENYTEALKPK